jgi:hypothetical protein
VQGPAPLSTDGLRGMLGREYQWHRAMEMAVIQSHEHRKVHVTCDSRF